jgi:integrase
MSLPPVTEIRKRIQVAKPDEAKFSLMAAYLFCARVSEIVGYDYPSDNKYTTARGPTGTDCEIQSFDLGPIQEQVAVFTLKTAKRRGKERKIALPLNPRYEPFTQQLVDYFKRAGSDKVFPFSRRKAYEYARRAFDGFSYPIDSYKVYENGKVEKIQDEHFKPFRTHALRHLRTTELIERFNFDGFDLSIYGGWTLRSMVGVGSAMSRYAHLQWGRYFPKLLKERR